MSVFIIDHISKSYITNKQSCCVLNNINLTLPDSGLVSIVGKSGSGKSTLLNILMGIEKPDRGRVLFNKTDISKMKDKAFSDYHLSGVSMVYQHFNLFDNQTALENCLTPLQMKGMSKKTAISKVTEQVIASYLVVKYIGLISNCFSEEAKIIKNSILYPYFDAICLSYDEGIMKPDKRIFELCMKKLNVNAEECLYIGDGGSNELDAASKVGMKAYQAVWYLNDNNAQQSKRQTIYKNIDNPLEILKLV